MSSVEHAVIAAAGFGSRLGRGMPKCLVEFRGRTLLDRQLELLAEVPDVRVVVGFRERDVIAHARALRPDVTIVRNPAYASTTTLTSYALGVRYLRWPALVMDADIVFEPDSFAAFLDAAAQAMAHQPSPALCPPLIGYTDAKTEDAVYVTVDGAGSEAMITGFARQVATPHEWANIALLPPGYCETGTGAVYERLSGDLPLPAAYVDSYEIDRPGDLDVAHARFTGPAVAAEPPSALPPLVPGQRRRQPLTSATGRPFSR
ncbi:MAG: NTP transferase domain-containing protein [Kineosporiaceae bacterium]|nr:NTP transferase domain-containing protein [Kineosporiaceae bacterium]